jgi:hypothetical protein
VGLWWQALAHPSLFLFSPPENSALLETPENESSKLHCGKLKLRPVYIEVGPGSRNLRSKTLLRMDLTIAARKLDIWIELGGMFSWVGMRRMTRFREETGLCYIKHHFFTFML